MDAIECIKTRRSLRTYQDKAIPKGLLEDLVDCGRLAPSARNVQPWHFIVVTEREKLKRIGGIAATGPFIRDAAACIVICGDKGNKHLVEDGCAATENILLAAHAHGLASCWVAGWKREYNPGLIKLLNIPSTEEIVSIIPLGYPEGKPDLKNKRAIDEVLHWEAF